MIKFKFPLMVSCFFVWLCLLLPACCFAQGTVSNSDVVNFWKAYDLTVQTKDTAVQAAIISAHYLRKGSEPLKDLLKMDSMTAATYVQRIDKNPGRYNRVRQRTLELAWDNPEIGALFRKYKHIYPGFHRPKVAFVIGTFNRGGTTTRKYILIGAEVMALDVTPSPVHTIAHELTHVQQNFRNGVNNEEEYRHLDLLGWAMMEGSCDFIAEVVLGKTPPGAYMAYGRKNEKALWEAFSKEMYGYNTDNWLYNGGAVTGKPADLGYYIGYAICKQYYEHAGNKRQALRDIINLKYVKGEHHAFFKKANYQP